MPLTYRDRRTSRTQLDIVSGKAVVGNLWKAVLSVTAGQSARWCWTWKAGPGAGGGQHGTTNTLEEAEAEIEAQWGAWLKFGRAAGQLGTRTLPAARSEP